MCEVNMCDYEIKDLKQAAQVIKDLEFRLMVARHEAESANAVIHTVCEMLESGISNAKIIEQIKSYCYKPEQHGERPLFEHVA